MQCDKCWVVVFTVIAMLAILIAIIIIIIIIAVIIINLKMTNYTPRNLK